MKKGQSQKKQAGKKLNRSYVQNVDKIKQQRIKQIYLYLLVSSFKIPQQAILNAKFSQNNNWRSSHSQNNNQIRNGAESMLKILANRASDITNSSTDIR